MNNNSPKKNFYVVFLLSVVLVFVLIFSVNFFLGMVRASYSELGGLYDSIENYQKSVQYLEQVSAEAVLAKEKQKEIDKKFIEENKEVDFIVKLEEIAEKTNNKIEIAIGSLPKEQQENNVLAFNVDLAGSFPDLLRFLDEMDSLLFLTDILSLNIQRIEKVSFLGEGAPIAQDNVVGNVKTDMIIKTYIK